jgi:APA family basic amino acid/polyamine antiporter
VLPGFGLAAATFVVISRMVGVGVLTTSGYAVATIGSDQLMLGLWLVGGVVALCGALTIAELSAALPASGGEYVFPYEAYGPAVAFLSGWVSLVIGFAAPIAAAAFAAASYLLAPFDLHGPTSQRAVPSGRPSVEADVRPLRTVSSRGIGVKEFPGFQRGRL